MLPLPRPCLDILSFYENWFVVIVSKKLDDDVWRPISKNWESFSEN
jgi:hypothetical protein